MWAHAYEAPRDLQEAERLRQAMLLVARRTVRQAPLFFMILCHTNPLCEEIIQEMVAEDFTIHTSQRCHPHYFEAAETSEIPVSATPSGKLTVFLYQRPEGTSISPTECHLQECYDVETRKRERKELIALAASRIADDEGIDQGQRAQVLDLLTDFLPTIDPKTLRQTSSSGSSLLTLVMPNQSGRSYGGCPQKSERSSVRKSAKCWT